MSTEPPVGISDETSADAFHAWATDPSRTLEERYGILQLLEVVYSRHYRGEDKKRLSVEAELARREARRFIPGYQPVLDPQRVRLVADLLSQVQTLDSYSFDSDRPIRDLSFLCCLPWLQNLTIQGLEIQRLDLLHHLPALRTLSVWSNEVEAIRTSCAPSTRTSARTMTTARRCLRASGAWARNYYTSSSMVRRRRSIV